MIGINTTGTPYGKSKGDRKSSITTPNAIGINETQKNYGTSLMVSVPN